MTAVTCPASPTGAHVLGEPHDSHDGVGTADCKYCTFSRKVITNPFAIKDPEIKKWAFGNNRGMSHIVLGNSKEEKKVVIKAQENQVKKQETIQVTTPAATAIPPKPPKSAGTRAIGKYYNDNREAILRDVAADLEKGLKDWGLSRGRFYWLNLKWSGKKQMNKKPARFTPPPAEPPVPPAANPKLEEPPQLMENPPAEKQPETVISEEPVMDKYQTLLSALVENVNTLSS